MSTNLHKLFKSHAEWIESEGESGEQLILENISSKQLTREQLQLLTDSVLTECAFVDTELNRIDLYRTEMYSCEFDRASFHNVQLIKSEVNDTEFTDTRFDSVSFSNAEMFDCIFTGCTFDNSTFISVGMWNTTFDECTLTNVDFESAYIENAVLVNSKFNNPINLEKATKIILNIGTIESPLLLSHEESVKWIRGHTL